MHQHGTSHPNVKNLLRLYEHKILEVLEECANKCYDEVDFYIFSDHGMHNVSESYNLPAVIEKLGFHYGIDYVAFYDSTMACFWFLKEKSRKEILECLALETKGRVLSDEELKCFGIYFPDRR